MSETVERRYSLKDVAEHMRKSVRTVKRRIAEKKLVVSYDGRPFVWEHDLIAYDEQFKKKETQNA